MAWQDMVNGVLGSCLSVFGEAVVHYDPDGIPYNRRGIYSDLYKGIDPNSGFEIVSSEPNLGIRLADWLPLPQQGDALLRSGLLYKVRHLEKDGEGGGTVFLDKPAGISGS